MRISSSFTSGSEKPTAISAHSDEELIGLVCKRGVEWRLAFANLVQRHRAWIYRRCLMRLGNPYDAEDVTQDVILRLYYGLKSFEGRGRFLSWLYRIVDNQCHTFAMRQAKYQSADRLEEFIENFQLTDCQETSHLDRALRVRRVLAILPEQSRDVLQLRFFNDCSLELISQMQGISLSAAKMRLYRALDQFKQLYVGIDDTVTILRSC